MNCVPGTIVEFSTFKFTCFEDSTFSLYNITLDDCEYLLSIGIEDQSKNIIMDLYPNPTNDLITLDISGYNGTITTQVYDLSGRLLKSTNSTTISLKDYAKGIYVFRVEYGDRVEELKVVKD